MNATLRSDSAFTGADGVVRRALDDIPRAVQNGALSDSDL